MSRTYERLNSCLPSHSNGFRDFDPAIGRYIQSDPIGLNGESYSTYAYALGNPLTYSDSSGLITIPDIPGAAGETSVHANPGPDVTDYRAEHDPPHVHLGSNDGPRVDTKNFEPLSDKDALQMTKKQRKFCASLSEETKDLIRQRQQQIFRFGRIIPPTQGGFVNPAAFEGMTPWGFFIWALTHSDAAW